MSERLPYFEERVLYETIVTTFDEENQPNAAAMGVQYVNGQLLLQPFFTSDTYRNLLQRKDCVINLTTSPELFVKAALFQEEFAPQDFLPSPANTAPLLTSCSHSYIAARVISIEEQSKALRAQCFCRVLSFDFSGLPPGIYSRAFSSLLEVLIHATRVCAFSNTPEKAVELAELFRWIDHHQKIILRITPKNSQYYTLLEKINAKIAPMRK